MEVQINYTTQLKAALNVDSERIELPPGSLWSDLLHELCQRHREKSERLLVDPQGNLIPTILVCVNDRQVRPDGGLRLSHGDEITLLSAISGG